MKTSIVTNPNGKPATGIDETLDLVHFLEAVGVSVVTHTKDGASLGDALKVIADVRDEFEQAVDGVKNVPAEFADLDPSEVAALSKAGIDLVFNLFASITK